MHEITIMYEELKKTVCQSNIELQKQNLIIYSWGNVSGIDRRAGVVAIKPSGVSYDDLTPEMIVLLDLDGNIVEGTLKPSSDTPTHLELYRNFETIGGICHTHSICATAWAQACIEIPCFGTTHRLFLRPCSRYRYYEKRRNRERLRAEYRQSNRQEIRRYRSDANSGGARGQPRPVFLGSVRRIRRRSNGSTGGNSYNGFEHNNDKPTTGTNRQDSSRQTLFT